MALLALLFGAFARGAADASAGVPLNFKIGELTEEESKSDVIPEQFRCAACKAAIFQIQRRLDKLGLDHQAKLDKSARREQAVRVAEMLEEACSDETYNDYGIKEPARGNGGKVLSGPGIDTNDAGVLQGGGKWPKRMGGYCRSLVEEEDLSAQFREGSLERFCDRDCVAKSGEKPRRKPANKPRPRAATHATSAAAQSGKATSGLDELPPPPHEHKVVTAENISEVIAQRKFHKFVLVLFFDASHRSAHAVAIWEYAARMLKKAKKKDLRKAVLARYDSSNGDTWGYNFQGPLPRGLLYRKGYRNPKKFDGKLDGPQDLVDWLTQQSANYMKALTNTCEDDPAQLSKVADGQLVAAWLDARSCLRADASEDSDAEAGIYERCVRALPEFESDAEISACPLCSETHVGRVGLPMGLKSAGGAGLPSHIQEEVDWRRQHTKLLREKIAMLEHESSMWEQKLHILGRRSPGTSPKNKIVQLFPKEKAGKLEQEPSQPQGSQGHAFAMLAYEPDIATLLETPSTAREVFEKMKHPRALQPLKPRPKVDVAQSPLEQGSGSHDLALGPAESAVREAEDECLQADQRVRQVRREELHRGLQNELEEMRLLEGERRKRREQKRAELHDELQQQLQQEKKTWQIRQDKQDLERKQRQHRQEAAHKELILVELERLRDKISLRQKFNGEQVAQQMDEARLQELLQIKLDGLAEEVSVDGPKILTVKCFDWNEWLSSVQKFVELTPQISTEIDAVFPGRHGNRTISLLEVDNACRGEHMKLSEQLRAGLARWMQTEGGRQAQRLELTLDHWLLFYGNLLSGRTRDKEADVLALEEAFKAIAGDDESAVTMLGLQESLSSPHLPELHRQMLNVWLQFTIKRNRAALELPPKAVGPKPFEAPCSDLGLSAVAGKGKADPEQAPHEAVSPVREELDEQKPKAEPVMQAAPESASADRAQLNKKAKLVMQAEPETASSARTLPDKKAAPVMQAAPVAASADRTPPVPEKKAEPATQDTAPTPEKSYLANLMARTQAQDRQPQPVSADPSTALEGQLDRRGGSRAASGTEAGTKAAEPPSAGATEPSKAKSTPQEEGTGVETERSEAPAQQLSQVQANAQTLAHPLETDTQATGADAKVTKPSAVEASQSPGSQEQQPKQQQADSDEQTAKQAAIEEDDSFVKEQWLEWFLSADLSPDEEKLLRAALQSSSSSLPLGGEVIRKALKAHEARVTPAEKEQLREWSQWVLEMDATD
ncbi:MZB1 [Symbiodinium sp. CCMP2592]|nr:MZB1 [Symbiodinium sp. CCMP2592]